VNFFAFILTLVIVTAVVSFIAAAFIRSSSLCVIASAVIAELLFVLFAVSSAADSPHPEDVLLFVNITLIIGTPVFIGSAVAFTFLARRLYRKAKNTSQCVGASSDNSRAS
jgi:hypothetical protein